MDLNTITVADFKAQFPRDFPYLPNWDSTKIYNLNAIVYYSSTDLFYQANQNGVPVNTLPTNSTYWNIYQDSVENYVQDSDITRAFLEAQYNLNQALFSDATVTMPYLYMTAHYLVMDLRTAQAGITSIGQQLVTSRGAGSMRESYSIPKKYQDDPFLSYFALSGYGLKYISLALPATVGNFGVAFGGSLP